MKGDWHRPLRRGVALVSLALGLSACGGGGGGSAGGGEPAPVPVPASEVPLALTARNVVPAASVAVAYPEIALMFAQLAQDWADTLERTAGIAGTGPCDGGGTLGLQLLDRDGNHVPSAGDQLTVTLSQCYVRVLDDVFDGTLTVDLTAPAADVRRAGTVRFGPRFVTGTATTIQLQGEIGFETRGDALGHGVRALSTATPLTLTVTDGRTSAQDSITQLDARKDVRRDTARITSSWKLRIASNMLGGSLQVSTATPFSGWFSQTPDAGRIDVAGAGSASVQALTPLLGLTVQLGTATSVVAPVDVATGYLWWSGFTPAGQGARGYDMKDAGPNNFAVVQQPDEGPRSQTATLAWQFSRPLAGAPLTATFQRTGQTTSGYDWTPYEIPADVSAQGAYVSLKPRTPLQPGISYRLLWSTPDPVDATGAAAHLKELVWTVADSITANAGGAAPRLLLGNAATLALDGRASSSANGELTSVAWRQVSGPALRITGATTLTPTLAIAAGASDGGVAELELEVRNAAGELDCDRVQVTVANDGQPFRLITYQLPGAAPVVRLDSGPASSSSRAAIYLVDGGRQVLDVNLVFPRLLAGQPGAWAAGQATAVDGTVAIANLIDTAGLPSGCTATGSWTVAELVTSPVSATQLSVDRLALDLSYSCGGIGPIKVSARVNSSRALP